jgi:hypothetical protein
MTKLPKQQQMTKLMPTGAKDIGIGSLNFYSFIVPCMIKAKETDDQQKMESCLCTVNELVLVNFSSRNLPIPVPSLLSLKE